MTSKYQKRHVRAAPCHLCFSPGESTQIFRLQYRGGISMKRINIKCPYCNSQAFLRPASAVHGQEYRQPGDEVYVCARYPDCDSYVSAHQRTHLPMGTLANRPPAHQAHGGPRSLQPPVEKRHDVPNGGLPLAPGADGPAAGGGAYRQVLRMAV